MDKDITTNEQEKLVAAKMAGVLQSIIDSCMNPSLAQVALSVELSPIRAVLKEYKQIYGNIPSIAIVSEAGVSDEILIFES